ncbi:MAG TPA: AraC family transcriptional regulator [Baekduia sp.]|nr:AraC family transcriptional regulator [Baekduia sp.]
MLDVDRLRDGAAVEVLLLDGFRVGEGPLREPHRHDYHELIWIRDGTGEHRIDDVRVAVEPATVTVIGRGQVHQFREARAVHGAVIRFADDALHGGDERIATGWLLAGPGGRRIAVPADGVAGVEALAAALHGETRRPADAYTPDLLRHHLSTLLLWLERWYDATRTERSDADDAAIQLHRRFARLLEEDFAAHHDARHYADALGVPAPALARALSRLTGRTTKELVLDRVMVEAARLLRHTDLTVGQIAHRVGFDDQLYFSRAFKRHSGRAPQAFRAAARGAEVHAPVRPVHSA